MQSVDDIPTNKREQRVVVTTKDGRCIFIHFFLNDSLLPTVKASGDIDGNDYIDVEVIGHIDATTDFFDGVVFIVNLMSDTYVTYSTHGDISINENGRFYIQSDGDKQNANCPYSVEYMEDEEHLEEFEYLTGANRALIDFSSDGSGTSLAKPIVDQDFNGDTSMLVLDPHCYNIVEMHTYSNNRSYQIRTESSDYYIDGMFVGNGGSNCVSTNFQILGTLPWYYLLNPIKDRSRAIPFYIVGNTMYVDNVKDSDVQYLTIERNESSTPTPQYYYALNNVVMPMYDNSAPFVKGDVYFSDVCTINGLGQVNKVNSATERMASHVSYVELPSDLDVYACAMFQYFYTELETIVFHNNKFRNPQDGYHLTESAYMFGQCTSLTSIDLEGCDTSEINSITHICDSCTNLTSVSLKGCDLSNVVSAYEAFIGCTSLTEVDFSGCDLSNVSNYSGAFTDCDALQTIKAVGCNQATIDLLNQVKPQNATVVTT